MKDAWKICMNGSMYLQFLVNWFTESNAFHNLADIFLLCYKGCLYFVMEKTIITFEILPRFGKGLFLLANTIFSGEMEVEKGKRS